MGTDKTLNDIAVELRAIRRVLERMVQADIFRKENKEETNGRNDSK